MKYLVTGCAGFIGFSLSRKLLENGSKVIGVDNFNKYYSPVLKKDRLDILKKNKNFQFYKTDISNLMAMDKIFLKNKPFTIAHLAAQAGVRYSLTHPFIYEKVNILGFLNILELAKKYKIKNIVYASSSSVYGGIKKIPFREDMVINQPVSLYGATKASNELFAYTYHHLYEINTIGLRFFTCFDGNTEVLTLNGIKNIKDILIGEKIYTLNPDTKNMEISNVVATQKLKAPKKMVSFNHPRVDLLVTKDHKMFVQTDKGFWRFYDAGTLAKRKSRYRLPWNGPLYEGESPEYISLWDYLDENHQIIIAPHSGKTEENLEKLGFPFLWNRIPNHYLSNKEAIKDPLQFEKDYDNCSVLVREHTRRSRACSFYFKTEAFVRFLGWYLTEGHVRTKEYAQITISQMDKENRREIIKTIKELGFRPVIEKKGISFSCRLVRNYLERHNLIGSYNKSIPLHCFRLSYDLRKVLWETMMKGDGDVSGKRYSTVSKKLAEDFFHLSLTLGKYALITQENGKETKIFRVRLRKERINPSLRGKHRKVVDYDNDFVYCVTTDKNHIIYAGRNRMFGWVGQCYGPWGRPDMALFLFTKAILENKTIKVFNYGKMKRDFTYIDDIVNGIMLSLKNVSNLGYEIFNLGCSDPVDLMKFIGYIENTLGKKAKKKMLPLQPGEIPRTYADVSKAQKLLGYKPKVKIKEGIKRFIDWYKQYYEV